MLIKGLMRNVSCNIDEVLQSLNCNVDVLSKDENSVEFICNADKDYLFKFAYRNNLILDAITYENSELYRCSLDETKEFTRHRVFFYVGECVETALKKYQFRY